MSGLNTFIVIMAIAIIVYSENTQLMLHNITMCLLCGISFYATGKLIIFLYTKFSKDDETTLTN